MSDLPPSWVETPLGDLCAIVSGSTPKSTEAAYWGGDIPWITPDDLSRHVGKYIAVGRRSITDAGFASCSTRMVPEGTVLYTSRAPIGYVAIAQRPVCTNQGFKSIIPPTGIGSDYLYWYMQYATAEVKARASGTTFAEISGKAIKAVPIRIAPGAEQERIVAAIEEQFSRLDAGVVALERIARSIERLRAAVLAAAVDGQITSPDPHRKQGDLPNGWAMLTPQDLADERKHALAIGPFGSNLKVVDYREDGVPLVFVRQVRSGQFDAPGRRFISKAKALELSAHRVSGGDVLITKMGEPPGDAAVYPVDQPDAVITADVIKLSVRDGVLPDYVALAINSHQVRRQFRAITKGVAQQKVSLARFRQAIQIPTPSLPEQIRIARVVRETDAELDRLRDAIKSGLARAATLRSAILTSAFSGHLVSQRADDEPAQALLDRMASGQQAGGDVNPTLRRGGKVTA